MRPKSPRSQAEYLRFQSMAKTRIQKRFPSHPNQLKKLRLCLRKLINPIPLPSNNCLLHNKQQIRDLLPQRNSLNLPQRDQDKVSIIIQLTRPKATCQSASQGEQFPSWQSAEVLKDLCNNFSIKGRGETPFQNTDKVISALF